MYGAIPRALDAGRTSPVFADACLCDAHIITERIARIALNAPLTSFGRTEHTDGRLAIIAGAADRDAGIFDEFVTHIARRAMIDPDTRTRLADRGLSICAEARRLNTDIAVQSVAFVTLHASDHASPWAVCSLGTCAVDAAALFTNSALP